MQILIRLLFFYFLFRLLFRAVFFFLQLAARKPNKDNRSSPGRASYQKKAEPSEEKKTIVDAEFEEVS